MHKITVGWWLVGSPWWSFGRESYLYGGVDSYIEDKHWEATNIAWH
jgi:hypothetical protein